jgi:Tfp pilus assembly protein PilN
MKAIALTLFPDMFPGPLGQSLAGKALEAGIWSLEAIDIRSFAGDKHRTVEEIAEHVSRDGAIELIAMGGDVRFAVRQLQPNWDGHSLARLPVKALEDFTNKILGQSEDKLVRKFKLTRRHRLAALGAGVVLMAFVWSQIAIASKRSELEKKKQQLSFLQPRAAALAKTIQETQRADQWYRTRNVWIDVLTSLRQNMSTSNLWIVTASFDDPGFIRSQGKARDDNHVTDFVTALKNSKKFATVAIERIDLNKGEKPEYEKDFTINAVLAGVDPKKKKN